MCDPASIDRSIKDFADFRTSAYRECIIALATGRISGCLANQQCAFLAPLRMRPVYAPLYMLWRLEAGISYGTPPFRLSKDGA